MTTTASSSSLPFCLDNDCTAEEYLENLFSALAETQKNLSILFQQESTLVATCPPSGSSPKLAIDNQPSASGIYKTVPSTIISYSSVGVQTDEGRSSVDDHRSSSEECSCKWMVHLHDAWELAGLRTRQRMNLLGRNYRRLYRQRRDLASRLKTARAQLRRSRHLQKQHQIILDSIGRQVEALVMSTAAGEKVDEDLAKSPSHQVETSSSSSTSLFRWYSNISAQLSWIRSLLLFLRPLSSSQQEEAQVSSK